jgi:zinc-binding alcohol dehydrogenase/oxidoreductase
VFALFCPCIFFITSYCKSNTIKTGVLYFGLKNFKKIFVMHALVLNSTGQGLDYQEVNPTFVKNGHVLVFLKAAALNHRDLWISKGQYAGIQFPTILGSDGAGEYKGKPVLINPSLDWGDNPQVQGKNYRILGLPDDGTFAEQVAVPRQNIVPMPQHLSFEQAAALPLAGLTAWRVLHTRCQWKKGERILITGIGGGVALFALQFAIAAGAEVFVTSGSDEKIEKAIRLGAKSGVNYRQPDWDKQLKAAAGGFDVIIDSAAGDGFAALPGLCNPGARIGIYGGTQGKINGLAPQAIFWKQATIVGSTMGNPKEFKQMVAFVGKHEIVPVVDRVFPLADGNLALQHMENGGQFGKIVLGV